MRAEERTAEKDVEALAAVLGEHRICWRTLRVATCTCGKWARPDEKGGSLRAPVRREHDAHVAESLMPLLARARDEARGEVEAAWDDGWNAAVDSNGFPGDVNPYLVLPPEPARHTQRYEPCVSDADGNCTRWSHGHTRATPPASTNGGDA